jgi:hypothetical protein
MKLIKNFESPYLSMFNADLDDFKRNGFSKSDFDSHFIDQLKSEKLKQFNAAAEREIQALISTYPPSEVTSFHKQENEARAWLADDTAATPLLDSLATTRGMDKATLVNKVIAKADAFARTSGKIIGKRQKLEDALTDLAASNAPEDAYQALTW